MYGRGDHLCGPDVRFWEQAAGEFHTVFGDRVDAEDGERRSGIGRVGRLRGGGAGMLWPCYSPLISVSRPARKERPTAKWRGSGCVCTRAPSVLQTTGTSRA